MINTQAVPQALQMGGKEAYHSPGELDICCCCFVVVVLLGVTVFLCCNFFFYFEEIDPTKTFGTCVYGVCETLKTARIAIHARAQELLQCEGIVVIIMWCVCAD